MQSKNKISKDCYVDGLLYYGEIKSKIDKQARKIGEEFIELGKLFFDIMSKRDQDIELANSLQHTLDLKIKTQKVDFKPTYKVKINDDFYDVYSMDSDSNNIYLYLERVIK